MNPNQNGHPRRRILVKIGGAILDDASTRAGFAASVAHRVANGDEVVVVHGGGVQVTRAMEAIGHTPQRLRGLRVTDDVTAQIVLQVLAGEVNARVVDAIERALDGPSHAIGVSGADGGLLQAVPREPELGHVGAVIDVNAAVLTTLVDSGFVPVVATVAPQGGGDQPFLNVNADDAVAPIARAWGADAVLFLSDVPHVAVDGARLVSLDPDTNATLEADGTIHGGMIPKTHAALDAARACPGAVVKIASGEYRAASRDVITRALDPGFGTVFNVAPQEVSRA